MGSADATASQIQLLRRAMLVRSAVGAQLDAVGNNRGVPRPENTEDDELYRRVIKALAFLPKSVLLSYYALLTAVYGTQEQAQLRAGRPWRVFEVNPNEVIIEIPVGLVSGTLETSTYLHGASGYARVPTGPANVFTTDLDLSASSAVSVVGLPIAVETSVGVWTNYTIVGYAFSSGVATVQVNLATLPAGGGRFYLEVPGDTVDSYRGDYVATGGLATLYSTAAGPLTGTLLVVGDVTRDVLVGSTIQISIGGAIQNRVVATTSYSTTTNTTTVTVTTTDVPGGQLNQTFVVTQEVADTATTPPHDDRIYITGTALNQVVLFYLNLLVRAAGIIVRFQVI